MALRNDSYALHLLLPTKVDPLVSLMKVEKVPDSTYDMIGGLDQQIKEIKEVSSTRWLGCEPAGMQNLAHGLEVPQHTAEFAQGRKGAASRFIHIVYYSRSCAGH